MGFSSLQLVDVLRLMGDGPKDTAMIEYGRAMARQGRG